MTDGINKIVFTTPGNSINIETNAVGNASSGGSGGGSGAQGPQGPQGPAGADGPQGPAGGPQGAQGPQGPAGSNGAQGPQGPQGPAGSSGSQGSQGPQGPQGTQGPQGATGAGTQGPQGPQGPSGSNGSQGPQGPAGASGGGIPYTFSTTTADADPGNGVVRYNNATIGSVTQIFIDNVDSNVITRTSWYDTWDDSSSTIKGYLYVTTTGGVNVFSVTGSVTVATGYYKIPVSYVSGSLPTNASVLAIAFSRTGDGGSQGVQGPTGPQGTQGPAGSGSQGPQGPQGPSGSNGSQGPQGPQGPAGTGAQGPQGPQGPTGTQGTQGPQGPAGTGAQGSQGPQGPQGPQGIAGTSGVPYTFSTTTTDADPGNGVIRYNNATIASVTFIYVDNVDTGAVDRTAWYNTFDDSTTTANRGQISLASGNGYNLFTITGAVINGTGYYKIPVSYVSGTLPGNGTNVYMDFKRTGDVGPQGTQGPSGSNGSQGPQGPQGPSGSNGSQGAQGPQGPSGSTGSQGPQGPQGPSGSTGSQGPQGPAGPQGTQGPQGPSGSTGSQGPQGPQGPGGSTGSQGPQGPAGPQGTQGPQGPSGSNGSQGPQGPQGPQGATGSTPTLEEVVTFTQTGTLATGTGKARLYFPWSATIVSVRIACSTAPTGASILVDVNKNGTTIFTTQGNRPSIAASGNVSSAATPDVTSFTSSDYMTIDIDQVGSTVAGAELTVMVRYTH